jgi:outer membrane scaffolding protein for murein synthesis (MipA/OmpV family)
MKKLFIFILTAMSAFAVERNISLGVYTQQSKYKGGDQKYYPNILATYGNYYLEGLELGKIIYDDKFQLKAFVQYDTVNALDTGDLSGVYSKLSNRKAPELIGFKTESDLGLFYYGFYSACDIRSNSLVFGTGIGRVFRPLKPLFLAPSLNFKYYSDNYGDYYFGVDEEESSATGFDIFQPGSGYKVEASLDTLLFFSEQIGVILRTSYEIIDPNWDSEILADTENFSGTLLCIYRF